MARLTRRTILETAAVAALGAKSALAGERPGEARTPTADLRLWYNQPAASAMNEALPIGNGRLGAVLFGGVARERICFNEGSLWTGDENPSGEYDTMGAYQAFGDLFLSLEEDDTPTVSCPSGHKAYFANEEVAFTVDGSRETKWCVERHDQPVIWEIALPKGPRTVTGYALTSGGDYPTRDPRDWELTGSDDGKTWTLLDRRTDQPEIPERGGTVAFSLATPHAFRRYRFTFLKNHGAPHFQIAEISLFGLEAAADASYRRELDLATGIHRTEFTRAGVRHLREAFASHPAQVLALRWSANRPGSVSGALDLKGAHGEVTTTSGTELAFSGALKNGLRYSARVKVIAHGGSMSADGDRIRLNACDEVTLLLAGATDYAMDPERGFRSGADPSERTADQLDHASRRGWDRLKSDHLKDVRSVLGRVEVDFGQSSPAQRALPTDRRKFEAAAKVDPELEALLFQYGRYLLFSCSREGGLPANLQGLWNDSNDPPWHSDYHANINIQMNYWPAEVANLPECHRVFFDLVRSQLPAWRKATAASSELRRPNGKPADRGWAIRTSHNTTGGMGWQWDKSANAWYCLHFWEHFAFGRDRRYLRDVAYPVLKETVEFWDDHLKALPDGSLVVPDGWSPEHGPHEDGVSYNQQIVWDLFTNYVEAATVLGADEDYRKRVADLRDRLAKPRIGRWGQLQEWLTDRDDPNDHHRHTSHLFAVYPGRQIGVTSQPKLAAAAKISLDARGETGDVREWSFAWRTALYARLRDAESAHRMVQQLFSARNTCPNLFGLHPPMQMDGNFGVTAGMAEMLLQSHEGEIHLLPALPSAWGTGSFRGLRARGGWVVEASWRGGRLTRVRLRNSTGSSARVRYRDRVVEVDGRTITLDADLSHV